MEFNPKSLRDTNYILSAEFLLRIDQRSMGANTKFLLSCKIAGE